MTEARIEEIVAEWERADADADRIRYMQSDDLRALIADWRAKKAEIERLKGVPGIDAKWPSGCHHPNSCARHRACMYVGCLYQGEDIADAISPRLSSLSPSLD